MPRSGTTLLGRLLEKCGVKVFAECSLPAGDSLVGEVRRAMEERWRWIDPASFDDRICSLVYEIWNAVSPVRPADGEFHRFASKTPNGELRFRCLDDALENRKPFYIYCHRSPLAVYRSLLGVSWGESMKPQRVVKRFNESLRRIMELKDRAIAMDVSRAANDFAYRTAWTDRLVERLGLFRDARTAAFLEEWPSVNRNNERYAGTLSERTVAWKSRQFEWWARAQGLDRAYAKVANWKMET